MELRTGNPVAHVYVSKLLYRESSGCRGAALLNEIIEEMESRVRPRKTDRKYLASLKRVVERLRRALESGELAKIAGELLEAAASGNEEAAARCIEKLVSMGIPVYVGKGIYVVGRSRSLDRALLSQALWDCTRALSKLGALRLLRVSVERERLALETSLGNEVRRIEARSLEAALMLKPIIEAVMDGAPGLAQGIATFVESAVKRACRARGIEIESIERSFDAGHVCVKASINVSGASLTLSACVSKDPVLTPEVSVWGRWGAFEVTEFKSYAPEVPAVGTVIEETVGRAVQAVLDKLARGLEAAKICSAIVGSEVSRAVVTTSALETGARDVVAVAETSSVKAVKVSLVGDTISVVVVGGVLKKVVGSPRVASVLESMGVDTGRVRIRTECGKRCESETLIKVEYECPTKEAGKCIEDCSRIVKWLWRRLEEECERLRNENRRDPELRRARHLAALLIAFTRVCDDRDRVASDVAATFHKSAATTAINRLAKELGTNAVIEAAKHIDASPRGVEIAGRSIDEVCGPYTDLCLAVAIRAILAALKEGAVARDALRKIIEAARDKAITALKRFPTALAITPPKKPILRELITVIAETLGEDGAIEAMRIVGRRTEVDHELFEEVSATLARMGMVRASLYAAMGSLSIPRELAERAPHLIGRGGKLVDGAVEWGYLRARPLAMARGRVVWGVEVGRESDCYQESIYVVPVIAASGVEACRALHVLRGAAAIALATRADTGITLSRGLRTVRVVIASLPTELGRLVTIESPIAIKSVVAAVTDREPEPLTA